MSLPSLRRRMLWRVLLPLALTWGVGSGVAFTVSYVFTRQAFDRSLLDDAYAIAANVSVVDGALALNLSPREIGAVLFDQSEKVFFQVLRPDGSMLAGHPGLREDPPDAAQPWSFESRPYRGLDLRIVTLHRETPSPFFVVVGQTVRSRSELLKRLLGDAVAPQAVLLLLLGWWLRRMIGRELAPLTQLQAALDRRDSHDLAPLALTPTTRDIGHLMQAINALMWRIAAGVSAQREFAGNVAHELRTPLAGIRSLAEYGLARSDPALWQAQLRQIVQSEQRASRLVDQLLALALADEARDSLRLEPVAVDAVVQDLLLRLLPRADAEGVDLGAVGLEAPVHALASVALLEGLLGNLIDNALRYGRPTDGAPPHVTVEVSAEGDDVLLSVLDNGPGLDAAQREQVMGRWAQGEAGLQRGSGSGLGLAIVARYVELLGGRFELSAPEPGRGLRASVTLRRFSPPATAST
jgi:two-component system sensor histidine kinase TctE